MDLNTSTAFTELLSMAKRYGSQEQEIQDLLLDPDSVLDSIEKYGTVKLGEIEIEEKYAICAFEGKPVLTMGLEEQEPLNWEATWRAHLTESWQKSSRSKKTRASGFNHVVKLEAHAVGIQNAAGPPGVGLLQPILVRWQSKTAPLSVFALPAVQTILYYKWDKWAKKFLIVEFIVYMLWLLTTMIFSFGLIAEKTDLSLGDVWEGNRGKTTIICGIASVIFMSPFLVIEVNTMWSYGRSWLKQFWNMIDMAMYTLQITIISVYLDRTHVDETFFSVMLALQCILLFTKIQYFSRVFDTSRGSLVDTLKLVLGDVKWFLLFIFLTMLSFGIAFSILYRDQTIKVDGVEDKTFYNVPRSVVSMFAFMLGGFHFEIFYEGKHNKAAAIVFFVIYESVMAIMLLNLLIAIMTDSYGKVMADERLWNLCSKAQIIDELETTLPGFLTVGWDRPYIHVLKPAPKKDVNLNRLWMKLDLAGEQTVRTTTELITEAEAFKAKVVDKLHEVRRRLDSVTAAP